MYSLILISIFIILSVLLSYQDIRCRQVDLISVIAYIALCIFAGHNQPPCFIPLLIIIFIGLFYYVFYKKKAFGMADYLIIFGSSFIINSETWSIFIIFCGLYGIIAGMLCKINGTIPFVPVILMSTLSIKVFLPLLKM